MKKLAFISLLTISGTAFSQHDTIVVCEIPDIQQAKFPGGKIAFNLFLKENMVFPPEAIKNNINGKCHLIYTISETGKVEDVRIWKNTPGCPECDAEAIRVLKMMPDWSPGTENGKPVKQHFNIPITFNSKTQE